MARPWRIGFVVPRYGEEILGGAETVVREMAEHLVSTGRADVHVLTTCARDHYTWRNELPPGETAVNGVVVCRFPIAHELRNLPRYHALHIRLIHGESIPDEEQYEWVDHSAHSPALYGYLGKWGTTFDFLVFAPYLFGTTFYGSAICPERSILWPCLHDEMYAYLAPTRAMYRASLGVLFNTLPESRLAARLYGHHAGAQVIGIGLAPIQADGGRFRDRSAIQDPFILYSGRLEGGKNVPMLIQHFLTYKQRRRGPLKLVLMGTGPEPIPAHPDVVSLGFQPRQDMLDVVAAASLLCQPSVNESFSIVMMESWLCGVPVLVHADCEVTRYNVAQANGGLYFGDYDEFEAALDLMLASDSIRKRMGANGKQYVETNYCWNAVLSRFDAALESWSALKSSST